MREKDKGKGGKRRKSRINKIKGSKNNVRESETSEKVKVGGRLREKRSMKCTAAKECNRCVRFVSRSPCVCVRVLHKKAQRLSSASQQMVSNLWRAPPPPSSRHTAGAKDPKWCSHSHQPPADLKEHTQAHMCLIQTCKNKDVRPPFKRSFFSV